MTATPSSISNLPKSCGVYLFKNKVGEVLYVGKALDLRARVRSYFTGADTREKVKLLIPQIAKIDFIEVESEFEALLLEAALIKKHLPKYNTVAKDDKHPLYIAITKEEFPKIRVVRRTQEIGPAEVFGPFPSGMTVRRVLKFLRRIFHYCSCKHNRGRPCLYASIGLCRPSPRAINKVRLSPSTNLRPRGSDRVGSGQVSAESLALKRQYQKQMRLLKKLLSGNAPQVVRSLEREMKRAAKNQNFELATFYRDGLYQLQQLLQPQRPVGSYLENPNLRLEIRQQAVKELAQILNSNGIYPSIKKLSRIEGYDISTLSGQYSTGSMVVFVDGVPDSGQYRRFKVKREGKPDDVGMMGEVLERRFSKPSWPLPDLIVLDGGKGQLRVGVGVLNEKELSIPIIALAKREEEIYINIGKGKSTKLKLPRSSPSLQILQHLRDEAHRFANKYRKKLIS